MAEDAGPAPVFAPATRAQVARLLTLDTDSPASVVSCVARARERGRTMRDVISTEMWEALNSFYLLARALRPRRRRCRPARTRSTRRSRSAARCSGACSTGRCCATRAAPSWRPAAASRRPTWCCGCCASRSRRAPRDGDPPGATRPRRWRCCTPSAASRPTAARSARAPTVGAGRALPALRLRLPGVGRLVGRGAGAPRSTAADAQPRSSPPVLRLGRLIADLELQRRAPDAGPAVESRSWSGCRTSWSWSIVTSTRAILRSPRWPPFTSDGARRADGRHELRDPLPHRVRATTPRSSTTSTRCASSRTGNGRQRCDEFGVRLTPEVRLHRHTDYFGTEVVEFEVSRPHRAADDRRPRAREHQGRRPSRRRATWEALADPAYREAGGEFLLQTDDAPGHPVLARAARPTRRRRPRRWPPCCSSPS